jgi:hypothetical protein
MPERTMDGPIPTASNAARTPFDPTVLARKHASFERLEAELTELWGHLNAATYRFLVLLAEFDRSRAFERHGLVSAAQWLNWQCGIDDEPLPLARRDDGLQTRRSKACSGARRARRHRRARGELAAFSTAQGLDALRQDLVGDRKALPDFLQEALLAEQRAGVLQQQPQRVEVAAVELHQHVSGKQASLDRGRG